MNEQMEGDELQGLSNQLQAMLMLRDDADADSISKDETRPEPPPLGARVRRGRDWKWGNQDGHGPGTVVQQKTGGILCVEWDNGRRYEYRHGAEDATDIKMVHEPRKTSSRVGIKVGVRVARGPHWEWGNQDGGIGNIGAVYDVNSTEQFNVRVRWPNGMLANYRYGSQGRDLKVLDQHENNGNDCSLPN